MDAAAQRVSESEGQRLRTYLAKQKKASLRAGEGGVVWMREGE